MGSVIRLHGDPHEEAQMLLPWYVTGRIDPGDRQAVETHLAACEACRLELAFERRLHGALAGFPTDAELGWSAFSHRIQSAVLEPEVRPPCWRSMLRRPIVGWAVAAQLALIVIGTLVVVPSAEPPAYRTLGNPALSTSGNMIVMFEPGVTEEELRRTLRSVGAELVGGPTSSHAYILRVPSDARLAALAKLRARTGIVLAEPIDAAAGE